MINDIGQEGIQIRKCKGHATAADVAAGRATEFTKLGNDHADHYAGKGVDVGAEILPGGEEMVRLAVGPVLGLAS